MKKKIIATIVVVVCVAIALIYFFASGGELADENIIVKPKFGEFVVSVTATGELKAKKSIEVRGPGATRSVGIWRMTISKLVDEGTTVDSGDFVAELDKSEISEKIKDKQLSVEQLESEYLQTKLDSSLELSSARDQIENLKFEMEEKKLLREQSKYEPPATIRQAEITYEKSKRAYRQAKGSYSKKVSKAKANISVVAADLEKERRNLQKLMDILEEFTINAPASGMVIYKREWSGRKRIVGSQISAWDPVVATLPDLTQMESVTYVNEVDIQKVKTGQKATIKLDANPDKVLTGGVKQVANIGEQRRNSDTKVFEVNIEIDQKDTTLLPSMTTSNEITIKTVDSVLHIPLECIHTEKNEKEKISYVYKKEDRAIVKKEVELGLLNENEAIVKKGANRNDELLLSVPDNPDEIKLIALEKEGEKKE